jgi:hypothetical protein
MPLDAGRTTTTEHSNFVWCHGSTTLSYAIRPILSIMDLIHDNDKWAIHTLHCPENGSTVAQAIIRGNAIAEYVTALTQIILAPLPLSCRTGTIKPLAFSEHMLPQDTPTI